ncbi:MAG TPA: WhiB family transcriptional regulator [Aeromicrobium sp.]|nr:WhiB family transcriptional regulator [Aeromicrobium sp.]
MTIVLDPVLPACVDAPEQFLDERLQVAPSTHAEAMAQAAARAKLHRACAACPLMVDCLYRAVVEVDVSGYVACTTEAERAAMRRALGIDVAPAPLMTFGAPRVGGGPVSHEAVLTMRQAHPKDTCQQLAERLGCSMSTIKRHLRREREHQATTEESVHTPQRVPTVDEVLDAFDALDTARVA